LGKGGRKGNTRGGKDEGVAARRNNSGRGAEQKRGGPGEGEEKQFLREVREGNFRVGRGKIRSLLRRNARKAGKCGGKVGRGVGEKRNLGRDERERKIGRR